jgi:hypothetical protein
VIGIKEWSLDFSMSPVESTSFGVADDSFVPSVITATGSFSGNREQIGGQTNMRQRFEDGSTVRLVLWEDSAHGFDIPTCIITGNSYSVSAKGIAEITTNFTTVGEIAYV